MCLCVSHCHNSKNITSLLVYEQTLREIQLSLESHSFVRHSTIPAPSYSVACLGKMLEETWEVQWLACEAKGLPAVGTMHKPLPSKLALLGSCWGLVSPHTQCKGKGFPVHTFAGPSQKHCHTLDVVLSYGLLVFNVEVHHPVLSDHIPIVFEASFHYENTKPHTPAFTASTEVCEKFLQFFTSKIVHIGANILPPSFDPSIPVICSAVLLFKPVTLPVLKDIVFQLKPESCSKDIVPPHLLKEVWETTS